MAGRRDDQEQCSGTTRAGTRCTLAAKQPGGTCKWHDPEREITYREGPRRCMRCGLEQPADHFYASGHGNGRRRVCIRCIRAERAAKASSRRHQRLNARGDVWCNACQRYRHPDHFKRHPSRPHTFWSYCRDCTRAKDRERYHRTKFRADKAAGASQRTRRKAVRRQAEYRERSRFVSHAIDVLLRRGFTLTEVARLTGLSLPNMYAWRRQAHRPTPAVEARFTIALTATSHLPTGETPAYRRRLPHPQLETIRASIAPELARHPVRSRWNGGAS